MAFAQTLRDNPEHIRRDFTGTASNSDLPPVSADVTIRTPGLVASKLLIIMCCLVFLNTRD